MRRKAAVLFPHPSPRTRGASHVATGQVPLAAGTESGANNGLRLLIPKSAWVALWTSLRGVLKPQGITVFGLSYKPDRLPK